MDIKTSLSSRLMTPQGCQAELPFWTCLVLCHLSLILVFTATLLSHNLEGLEDQLL